MTTCIKLLVPGDETILASVASGVFDHEVGSDRVIEFLNDPRHHIAVAIEAGVVVGFATAVHYVHPDKSPELWINEVGVAEKSRNRGVGKKLLSALLEHARSLGCIAAWVLTDRANIPAMRLYASAGAEAPTDHVMFNFTLDP